MHGGFLWDDDAHITANGTLRSWQGLWEIWFKPGATCQYYPLSFTVFWAEYQLWGLHPLGYHLVNIALHCVVAVLLWQILKRLGVGGAWLAGAIFALHPVCVMSVAWMTELKNTLSASLALGAGWAYLRYAGLGVYNVSASGRVAWRYGVLSLVLFLLAMLAKTAVSFLPATLLLVVWWQRGRVGWREVVPLVGMLGLVVGMGQMTFYIEHLHGAEGAEFHLGLGGRVLVSGRSFWFYLGKIFFPYPLMFIYQRWEVNGAGWWQYVLYPGATVGLLAWLWWKREELGRGPLVALGHFYISTSLLVLIVVLYMTRYSYVSDHWQYFGCLGVMALVGAGITRGLGWLGKRSRFLKPVLIGILLTVLGLMTWRQCGMYTDLETLWRTTITRNPNCWMAYNNLGPILNKKGQTAEAIGMFRQAIRLKPDLAEAHFDLGNALGRKGQIDAAIDQYQQAIRLKPDYAEAYNNLGAAFDRKGLIDAAIDQYQETVRLKPDDAEARFDLGVALFRKGQIDEAIDQFQAATRLKPDYAEAHNNLGVALDKKGQLDEAINHFHEAIRERPDFADAHNNLATLLAALGRLNEAVSHYRTVIELNPTSAAAHGNLADILAVQGKLEEAVKEYQRTLALVPNSAQAHFKYGQALQAQRDYAGAKIEYQKALELDPKHVAADLSLAWLLATCPEASLRDGHKAVALTEEARTLGGDASSQMLDVLAAAYAETGRYGEAVETAKHALNLPAIRNNPPLAEVIQSRLKLYEVNTPYHEKP